MDEDIAIINSNTRNQRIKDFFTKNKKLLISCLIFLILILLGFYSYQIYQDKNKIKISDRYNSSIIKSDNGLLRVSYGQYATRENALAFLEDIKSKNNDAWLLTQ